jgi:hypothetical protein
MVATNQSLEAAGGVQQVAGRRGAPLLSQSLIIESLHFPSALLSRNCQIVSIRLIAAVWRLCPVAAFSVQ